MRCTASTDTEVQHGVAAREVSSGRGPGLDFRWVSCGRLALKRKGEGESNIINTSGVTVSS